MCLVRQNCWGSIKAWCKGNLFKYVTRQSFEINSTGADISDINCFELKSVVLERQKYITTVIMLALLLILKDWKIGL